MYTQLVIPYMATNDLLLIIALIQGVTRAVLQVSKITGPLLTACVR